MSKRSAYILLFLFILHDSAFNQLLKLPALVTHFRYHHELDPQLSFANFLNLHYHMDDDGDNDQEMDKQLPYKQVDAHALHHAFVPLAKVIAIREMEYQSVDFNYPILKDHNLPEPAVSSLFRPPQA